MLPSETMIWQPEFTDKTLSRKPGAVQLLNTDVNSTLRKLSKTELHPVYIRIDTVRRSALINMCFQLGVSGVCQFKKFLGYMAVGDYQNAADEALDSRWARQTPNRAKRVTDVIRYGDFRSYN